jgi:hypothetical protein
MGAVAYRRKYAEGGLLLGCEPDVSLDQPQQRIGGQLLES